MDPRFRPTGGAQHYIGPSGYGRGDSLDGGSNVHPTTADGTLEANALYTDLTTGKQWYFDGYGWFPARTPDQLLIEEIRKTREVMVANASALTLLLEEIRDALMKIA